MDFDTCQDCGMSGMGGSQLCSPCFHKLMRSVNRRRVTPTLDVPDVIRLCSICVKDEAAEDSDQCAKCEALALSPAPDVPDVIRLCSTCITGEAAEGSDQCANCETLALSGRVPVSDSPIRYVVKDPPYELEELHDKSEKLAKSLKRMSTRNDFHTVLFIFRKDGTISYSASTSDEGTKLAESLYCHSEFSGDADFTDE